MQGYGQTEAGPVISANPPDAIRIDTVGPPLRGVELRLAEDGEILVRGDLVMDGYWGRPEDTAADRSATAGCTPATSGRWTMRDICASPIARRT